MCACDFCVVKCVHHKRVCNGGIVHRDGDAYLCYELRP